MEDLSLLTSKEYTPTEFVKFYKNTWIKNLVAQVIAVEADKIMSAANPSQMVIHLIENQQFEMTVSERLEHKKLAVENSLNIMAGITSVEAELAKGTDFATKYFSEEYLSKTAPVTPKPEMEANVIDTEPTIEGDLTTPEAEESKAEEALAPETPATLPVVAEEPVATPVVDTSTVGAEAQA